MNVAQLTAGTRLAFTYTDSKGVTKERMIELEQVKMCKNGNEVMVGIDLSKDEPQTYRSFTVNKMMNVTVV